MRKRIYPGIAFLAASLTATPAFATNGYFLNGYGAASAAMGGVGYALPQDSLAPAANPAGLTLVGDRFDAGIDWFIPRRGADIEGNQSIAQFINSGSVIGGGSGVTGTSENGYYDGNSRRNFYLPSLGYSHQYNETFSYGIAMYGNGGLNTDYATNPFAGFQLSGKPHNAGVNLEQLYISPSLAVRISDHQSLGVSLNVVYQLFKAYGLQAFALKGYPSAQAPLVGPFSVAPDNVTDRGLDRSYGFGYRLGYLAEPFEGFTIGASWQPLIHMKRFERYSGLFAGHGSFDVPENYGAGIAWRWRKALILSADVQRILYSGVQSVGNGLQPFVDGVKLGADGGPGFGWQDMTIYKFGAAVRLFDPLLLRLGYSYGKQPIPQDQTLFNILAPGVIQHHYTAGLALDLGSGYELNLDYTYAPEYTVYGHNSIPSGGLLPPQNFGGGEANIRLKEQDLGLSLAVHF
ncbi:MAG: OmpP1/FadL family transporter [Stenotrophobium sp.]